MMRTNKITACILALKYIGGEATLANEGIYQMKELEKYIDQLEADAEIGIALKKWFSTNTGVVSSLPLLSNSRSLTFFNTNQLVEWMKGTE
jgi:hypothetical protein